MVETRAQKKAAAQAPDSGTTMNGSSSSSSLHPSKSVSPISEEKTSHSNGKSNTEANANPAEEEVVKTPTITIVSFILIAIISVVTFPESLQPVGKPTVNHVWYFGWISAISTGLGVLPLIFSPEFNTYYVGVTNGKKNESKTNTYIYNQYVTYKWALDTGHFIDTKYR